MGEGVDFAAWYDGAFTEMVAQCERGEAITLPGLLPDWQIAMLCGADVPLITPFDAELLNTASYDVTVGATAKVESPDGQWLDIDLTAYSVEHPLLISPKEFLLVQTAETFNLPSTIASEFRIKSSRAREGWSNALAVWCDPGWHGSVLTMELINERRYKALPLYPGLKIGQMVFWRCAGEPDVSYAVKGRYNGDRSVMASKG